MCVTPFVGLLKGLLMPIIAITTYIAWGGTEPLEERRWSLQLFFGRRKESPRGSKGKCLSNAHTVTTLTI